MPFFLPKRSDVFFANLYCTRSSPILYRFPAGWEQRHSRGSPSQLDQLLTDRIAVADIVALALRKKKHRFTSSIRVAVLYWSYLKQSNEMVRAKLRALTSKRAVVRATVADGDVGCWRLEKFEAFVLSGSDVNAMLCELRTLRVRIGRKDLSASGTRAYINRGPHVADSRHQTNTIKFHFSFETSTIKITTVSSASQPALTAATQTPAAAPPNANDTPDPATALIGLSFPFDGKRVTVTSVDASAQTAEVRLSNGVNFTAQLDALWKAHQDYDCN